MLRGFTAALIGIFGLSLSTEAAAANQKGCQLKQIAELPVTMRGMHPLVTAKINGKEALFLADSGAFFSTMSAASAAEFGLKLRAAPFGLFVGGVGGTTGVQVTTVDHLNVAGIDFPKHWDFIVGGSEVSAASGILGQNILRMADVEYDLANGVIRLIKPEGNCHSTTLVYWAANEQQYSDMDIDSATPIAPHTMGSAYINGRKIHVVFDTGNPLTALTRHAAGLAGVTPQSPGVKSAGTSAGFGRNYVQSWIAPFQSFKIGQEEIKNTRLRIIDELNMPDIDMLIGADFFLSHRVYVANSQRKLYFTYNGGPVFNLTTSPNTQMASAKSNPTADTDATAAPAEAEAPPPTPAPVPANESAAKTVDGEPNTAEGFSRRGTAWMARRDFVRALADLSRACELAPQEPQYFFERAQAYLGNKQPVLANADIDRVLELKPNDAPALLWRARRHLNRHDPAAAVADLDAVDHAVAPQAELRIELAALYGLANQLPQAISQYNLWIAAHDKDVELHEAFNGLCWARSRLGAAPEQGIKDCDKALHLTPNNAMTLDGRGLLRLRTGDFDHAIGDYTASLKAAPRNPWALYGRGLAEAHKQNTAAAEGDIAAATALAPHIAEEFKKHGVAP